MDAQRSRRTKDQARKTWYAYYRQVRFARWFGFIELDRDGNQTIRGNSPPGGIGLRVRDLTIGPVAPLGDAGFPGSVEWSLRPLIAVPRARQGRYDERARD